MKSNAGRRPAWKGTVKAFVDSMGLEKRPQLRLFLKRMYCRLIDPFDRGRDVALNIGTVLHVPTYMATRAYADYEEAGMRACRDWLKSHPRSVMADVGCSLGIYSALALQVSHDVRVYAFDSDWLSLKATAEFCRFSDLERLGLVHGFLTESHSSGMAMEAALGATRMLLAASNGRVEPTEARFLCLNGPIPDEVIPRHSLDGLLLGEISRECPALMKIDVEGAELIVLRGAAGLLQRHHPTIMLSVHPQFLPSFQQTASDVAAFLRSHGYEWTVLSRDHEEHWWCVPCQ